MAKFIQAGRAALIVTMIAGLGGCNEKEKAPPPAVALTVGGTVSGLAGKGLVLQLNGADDLAVSASGKFNFPKALNKGNAYAVTVKASPSAPVKQTCTVSQGNGSIAGAAVNNVTIACTTNSYAVGGKVAGLTGKGLGLQLNGTHDVAIEKNGNFIFPGIRLPDGSDYRVAIKTMPARQMCAIEPISAAPDNDTIHIVSVTCSRKSTVK
ncbi:MAG: hypothetical protein HY938_00415 [Nitrosomonadales bacterium]|nr:hypothetical protein [Nitrosomonadales bacterium]